MARPFRFGAVSPRGSLADWPDFARRSEDLGYSSLVVPDHFDRQLPPLLALASAAAVTTRIRLGTIVINNDFRHPAALAKEAAMIDALSGGRLELGLGAGWEVTDYTKAGLPLRPASERIERLAETIAICKAFFTQESVTFSGKHFQLQDLDAYPRAVQRPHPPLMIGGRRRRMLSLAAREADIVGISMVSSAGHGQPPAPTFAQKADWVREAAGPRFADIEVQVHAANVAVTDHPASALEQIAGKLRMSCEQLAELPTVLVGSVEAIIEQLHAWRERCGVSYYVIVGQQTTETFAPVVARLAGK
jgi:probable F420-dependent oxidoreductase